MIRYFILGFLGVFAVTASTVLVAMRMTSQPIDVRGLLLFSVALSVLGGAVNALFGQAATLRHAQSRNRKTTPIDVVLHDWRRQTVPNPLHEIIPPPLQTAEPAGLPFQMPPPQVDGSYRWSDGAAVYQAHNVKNQDGSPKWRAHWADRTPLRGDERGGEGISYFPTAVDAAYVLWHEGEGPGAERPRPADATPVSPPQKYAAMFAAFTDALHAYGRANQSLQAAVIESRVTEELREEVRLRGLAVLRLYNNVLTDLQIRSGRD